MAGRGSLTLFKGPMFSGKTTALLDALDRQKFTDRPRAVLVKYAGDTRYDEPGDPPAGGGASRVVRTHSRLALGAGGLADNVRVVVAARIADVAVEPGECVGVDEGQFFPDLEECDRLATAGHPVFVAALSGDFNRDPFPAVARLDALADRVVLKAAVCAGCRARDAPFTQLTAAAPASGNYRVGGAEAYRAVCRDCWRG